jgi:hypothetical protein
MSVERTFMRTFFLLIGVVVSWITFDTILRRTENPLYALLALAFVLAFWIGALRVIVRVRL